MAHPIHKLVGPMLRDQDADGKPRRPASVADVENALITPVGLRYPRCIVDEWVNEARRKNGLPSTSAILGAKFRTAQELRRRPKQRQPVKRLSRLQRIARRITRLFRRH